MSYWAETEVRSLERLGFAVATVAMLEVLHYCWTEGDTGSREKMLTQFGKLTLPMKPENLKRSNYEKYFGMAIEYLTDD